MVTVSEATIKISSKAITVPQAPVTLPLPVFTVSVATGSVSRMDTMRASAASSGISGAAALDGLSASGSTYMRSAPTDASYIDAPSPPQSIARSSGSVTAGKATTATTTANALASGGIVSGGGSRRAVNAWWAVVFASVGTLLI